MSVFASVAEQYHNLGFKVLPLIDKRPFFKDWQNIRVSDSDIIEWCSKYKDNNIGIQCGGVSGIEAFDFDYLDTHEDFEHVESQVLSIIPNSPVVKRGKKGWTMFYKFNNNRASNLAMSFDLLSTKKQTVLPPSIHPETKEPYIWLTEHTLLNYPIDKLPVLDADTLKRVDDVFINSLGYKSARKIVKQKNGKYVDITSGRHSSIIKFGLSIVEKHFTIETLANALIDFDKLTFKDNPYFEDESELKGRSKLDYAIYISNSLITTVSKNKSDAGISWEFGKNVKPEHFFYPVEVVSKSGDVKVKYVPDYSAMAEWAFKDRRLVFDDMLSLIYNEKNWEWLTKNGLNNLIWDSNLEHISPSHVDNFAKAIKSKCFEKAFKFKDTSAKININNGILDIKTGELSAHSNEYLFRCVVPVNYDKNAKCDEWIKTLNFILEGNKDLIRVLQKIFGYVLIDGDPFLHKAFVLYGTGRNGKSTVLRILMALIGKASYSSVSLSNLNKPFSAVMLDGKLANIVEETPTDEINAEIFKTLVGGGEIPVAHKGLDEYNLKVNARFIFACNDMPVFKDKSKGLLDRLLFIPFNVYIPEEERDTAKIDTLMCELPGILNWALEGAQMIIKDRFIENTAASLELKEIYKEDSDPTYSWFKDCIEVTASPLQDWTSRGLYKNYCEDCDEMGMKPYSLQRFVKRLRSMIAEEARRLNIYIEPETAKKVDGKTVRILSNINYIDKRVTAVTACYGIDKYAVTGNPYWKQ